MMQLNIPNDVAAKLAQLTGEANTDYGTSVIRSWPGYPAPMTKVDAEVSLDFKGDAKFPFYTGDDGKGQKAERDGFSVRFKYKGVDAQGATIEFSGVPMVIPYSKDGLPKKALSMAEMKEGRLATNLCACLGWDKTRFNQVKAAGGWTAILQAFVSDYNAYFAAGVPLKCGIELHIRKYPKKNDANQISEEERKNPTGEDGEDIIRTRLNSVLPS